MTTVITYGTFDLFHKGHYNILKRARELGDYLIVGVTSESYDIERGKLNVKDSLVTRIKNVEDTGFADKIILEEYEGQKINDVIKYGADILVVGSDWRGKFDYLNKYCKVVYLERTKGISSTLLRHENGSLYRLGMATDDADDRSYFEEALYVSGAHPACVYCADSKLGNALLEEHQLESAFTDFDQFLDASDIVYVKVGIQDRLNLILRALRAGKHVIAASPIALDRKEAEEAFEIARENSCVLVEDIRLAYLRAFTQLDWQVHGGVIGDIQSATITAQVLGPRRSNEYEEIISSALLVAVKLFGSSSFRRVHVARAGGDDSFHDCILLEYENSIVSIELSNSAYWRSSLSICGTEGVAHVPDDWWNMGYFKISDSSNANTKRFSFNFEGNGFRYLIQELLTIIDEQRDASSRLTEADSLRIMNLFTEILEGKK